MEEQAAANAATVGAIYEAFGRGDVPFIIDQMAEDVAWEDGATTDHGAVWLRPGTGKAHVASFFENLPALEIKRFEPTHIAAQGDVVMALIEIESVVVATGREIRDLEIHVWRFGADGKVTAFRHVVDTAQHAAAVRP